MDELSDIFSNKEEREDFSIAFIIIAFFFGYVLISTFILDYETKEVAQADEMILTETSLSNINQEETLHAQLLAENNNSKKLDKFIDDRNERNTTYEQRRFNDYSDLKSEESIDINAIDTVEQQSTVIEPVDTVMEIIDTIKAEKEILDTQAVNTIESKIEETVREEVKEIQEETKTKNNNATASPSTKKSTKSNCLIIVGSFSDGDNANKLILELKTDGYDVESFFRKTNKVVGVRTNCDNVEKSNRTLEKIRKNFAKDAWIMKR